MSKKTIWLVTFSLLLTLIGLIAVQGFWIRNALRINEQQFDHLINKTLDNVVSQLENQEVVYKIANEVEPYEETKEGGNKVVSYHTRKLEQTRYSFSQYNLDKEIFEIKDLDSLDFSTQMNLMGEDDISLNTEKKNPGITKIKDKFLKSHLEDRLQTDLSEKKVFVENIVNKLIQGDVGIENRINRETLDTILSQELRENGVNLEYEFAVYQRDSLIMGSERFLQGKDRNEVYKNKLFPNDLIQKSNYLNVYFENRQKYIFKSMGSMTVISLVLSLVVILGFAITTHIMFKQKRLSLVKNDFVNNMTHELKTPISTISLASQMLKDESIPKESKNFGQISSIIDDETQRLSHQVEKVLKTALFNKGKIKIKPKELDLHRIIVNVIKSFKIQVEQKNGAIHKHLHAENHVAWLDEVHFTNIIFNLLDNAVKYSNENPDISVTTKNTETGIQISIEDNGIGIRKKDQKKIFEQFYRVPTGNRHDVKGFGLGLNYVKKMVEEHGGKIELTSEFKKGTRFDIIIPNHNPKHNGRKYSQTFTGRGR